MKKVLLVTLLFVSHCFIGDSFSKLPQEQREKLEEHGKKFIRFMRNVELRNQEVHLLAQECQNGKNERCAELNDAKKALVQGIMNHYDEFSPEFYVCSYVEVYMNREELYHEDEDILNSYQGKFSPGVYKRLEDLEEHLNNERMRTIVGSEAVTINPTISSILPLDIIDNLKINKPEEYKAFVNYFAESTAARVANTKIIAIDSNEKADAHWRKGIDQRSEETKKMIENMLLAMKENPDTWEVYKLDLAEVREQLEKNQ